MNSFRRIIHATGFSSVFKRIMHAQFFFLLFCFVLFISSSRALHFSCSNSYESCWVLLSVYGAAILFALPFWIDGAALASEQQQWSTHNLFSFQSNHIELWRYNIKATHAYRDHCWFSCSQRHSGLTSVDISSGPEQTAANEGGKCHHCERMKNCVIFKMKGNCLIDRIVCKWNEREKKAAKLVFFFLFSPWYYWAAATAY